MSVLFLAKDKPFAKAAVDLLRQHVPDAEIVFGVSQEPFPNQYKIRTFDYVISYISPWIIPPEVLANATVAAINLHPGPPEYPGIGCTNFAIYDNASEFGITVHHMLPKVDTGEIIMVKRFPIVPQSSVYALSEECYKQIFAAFSELVPLLKTGIELPRSQETWKRQPYLRKELNELCRITPDMSDEEIKRRIRATTYPGMPGAYVELGGIKFIAPAE